MKAFFFIAALILISASPKATQVEIPKPNYAQCIITRDGGRTGTGQQKVSFYNACNERLYINACMRDSFGYIKLYKSGQKIQVGGTYTIFTFPGLRADSIQWIADPLNPGVIPVGCRKV